MRKEGCTISTVRVCRPRRARASEQGKARKDSGVRAVYAGQMVCLTDEICLFFLRSVLRSVSCELPVGAEVEEIGIRERKLCVCMCVRV